MQQMLRVLTAIALTCGMTLPALAALPDQETYEFVSQRYNLPIENTRGGCTYYANPDTLYQNRNNPAIRGLSVLLMRGEQGGSMCNGVFEFKDLTVNCQTEEVVYSDRIGSPATWNDQPYVNSGLASEVCALGQ